MTTFLVPFWHFYLQSLLWFWIRIINDPLFPVWLFLFRVIFFTRTIYFDFLYSFLCFTSFFSRLCFPIFLYCFTCRFLSTWNKNFPIPIAAQGLRHEQVSWLAGNQLTGLRIQLCQQFLPWRRRRWRPVFSINYKH